MASAAASKRALLADDVPWRASPAGAKPVPRIHQNPVLRLPQNPNTSYALAVMKRPDPIGEGLAMEATLEAAGPDCIVPGQATPVKLLGLKVWPIDINFKFMEPVGRELQNIGKMMDSALNLMNASFQDR
ncbi:uncharacterized protein LOC103712024 [Phoenix dactylifera]|uniref:Uncharacterized protein LOC103712024 n=1 Tax=Phoenix dactylifera TaxID=42345 RepID=A0A8B8ZNW4_PHODC|nr:uncharacterized protein LOC103712024 [Phoenix dactylifera]